MKEYCRREHRLTGDNIYIDLSGKIKCKVCRKISRKLFNVSYPWIASFKGAKARCRCKGSTHYHTYGGKGIKFLMTKNNFKYLWFRDKAFEMKKPSIDRIDNDGHYELKNCRFIELSINAGKDQRGEKQHSSKLKEWQVKNIRELSNNGIDYNNLAKRFKVSTTMIRYIVMREKWKHLK